MKKIVFLLLAIVIATSGCKNKKQADLTILGEYSSYSNIHEKVNGKVESLTQKFFMAVPDGDKFKKGSLISNQKRDSLGLMYDFVINFDNSGDVINSYSMDENGKPGGRWELTKERGVLALANRITMDTLTVYHKFKCDPNGKITGAGRYRPRVDTLISSYQITYNPAGDTQTFQSFDYKGVPTTKRIAVLGADGRFLEVSFYNKDGVYTGGQSLKYNDKGIQSGITYYDKDKEITTDWVFADTETDDQGNWIKATAKGSKGLNFVVERTISYFR